MNDDWKKNYYLAGGILGGLIGILAAYLIVKKAEEQNTHPRLNASGGVKVGLGVLTLLRQILETILN